MAYFTAFPTIAYPFTIDGVDQIGVIKVIILNVRFRQEVLDRVELYDEYLIHDGATPEHISEILYGDPNYHWTIMLINGRFDRINDFPVSERALEDYTYKKYRASESDLPENILYAPKVLFGEVLWREDYTGLDCNPNSPFSHIVSNIEYETAINESKRRIRVINPSLIEQTVKELKALM